MHGLYPLQTLGRKASQMGFKTDNLNDKLNEVKDELKGTSFETMLKSMTDGSGKCMSEKPVIDVPA